MSNHDTEARSAKPTKDKDQNSSLEWRLRNAQVVLAADGIRDIALSSPGWASIMAVLFGGLVPQLGQRTIADTWPWIILCAVVGIAMFGVWRAVKDRAQAGDQNGPFQMAVVVVGYFAVGASWSLIVPIFWHPGNALNHCFLLVLIMGAVSLFLNSTSGKFEPIVAATLPNLTMIWIHFAGASAPFDIAMTVLVPIWAAQLHVGAWRGCRTIADAHRTKLRMECLANDLAAARDQAFQASRAKSTFLANMSHELRTPLNAIMAFSEVIATEAFGPNAQGRYRQYAKDVLASGHHLLGLVNDLLDLSKIEAGKLALDPKWLDAASLMQECSTVLNETARNRNIRLRATCTPSNLRVFGDERAIKQITINLLSNSLKYTAPGGFVCASVSEDDMGSILCVQDNGKGIPPDQLSRIQQPFEQLDNRYGLANGGSGLGLSLARALAELHGGSLGIESVLGKGTTVRVRFPKKSKPPRTQTSETDESAAA